MILLHLHREAGALIGIDSPPPPPPPLAWVDAEEEEDAGTPVAGSEGSQRWQIILTLSHFLFLTSSTAIAEV